MPFTADQFFGVFAEYNQLIYPAQWMLHALGLLLAGALIVRPTYSRLVVSILGVFWLWSGIVYHFYFFTKINAAAYIFSTMFITEGILFLLLGVGRQRITFRRPNVLIGWIGFGMIGYALLLYPAIGFLLGHEFPRSPAFGAPCPITIFTFGALSLTEKCPLYIFAIPLVWAFIATSAVRFFGMYEDFGVTVAAAVAVVLVLAKSRSPIVKEASA